MTNGNKPVTEITFISDITKTSCLELIQTIQDEIGINTSEEDPRVSEIIVHLSSPGGDPEPAFQVYGYLRSLPVPLTMHNSGVVDSAALLLFLAANTRVADPRAAFLLHAITLKPDRNPTIHTLRNWLSRMESESQRYAQIFKERTQISHTPLDIIKVLYDGIDERIDTARAVDIGICTQLIDSWQFPKHGIFSRLVMIKHSFC